MLFRSDTGCGVQQDHQQMGTASDTQAESFRLQEEQASEIKICAPLNGTAKALQDVNDPTFSEGILGQGAAIIPSEGRLYAPFDGKVSSVFDTRHAICLEHAAGAEMLIHIGLETVSLGGKYYTAKVKDGDTVKTGDLLIEFDLEEIQKEASKVPEGDTVSITDPYASSISVNSNLLIAQFCASRESYKEINIKELQIGRAHV